MASSATGRSVIQLYRDCLRLVRHIAPGEQSPKAIALRTMVQKEFKQHKHETNPEQIETYKANAVRALSNYVLTQSAPKDPKVKSAMQDYHERSVPRSNQ